MQVQRRPTTKDLDDARVGYEKKYDDARAGRLVGFASECNFRLLVSAHAGNLIFGGFAIRSFLVLSLNRLQFYWFSPKWLFRKCLWFYSCLHLLRHDYAYICSC